MTQTIFLTGVIEDGSERDPNLPRSTATTILFPQFANVELNVLVHTAAGAPVDLTAVAPNVPVGTFTLRNQLGGCNELPLVQLAGGWPGAPQPMNRLRFAIEPKHTRKPALGRHFFDVWLELFTGPFVGRWQVVATSAVVLQAALQRA